LNHFSERLIHREERRLDGTLTDIKMQKGGAGRKEKEKKVVRRASLTKMQRRGRGSIKTVDWRLEATRMYTVREKR